MKYEKYHININGKKGIYHELNNLGIDAHFYPANGFPIGAYNPLLKSISSKFKLSSLAMRACWNNIGKPKKQTRFDVYADDLIFFLKQKFKKPIIGIGHSQGATCTIIAASKNPELFNRLILIEPASLTKYHSKAMNIIPYSIKKNKEPFKSTIKKPELWKSKKDYFDYCRKSKAFKRISDTNLKEIVKYSLIKKNGEYKLIFPPKWEVSNYALPPSITHLINKIDIPIQIIAGKPNLFFSQNLRNKWLKKSENLRIEVLESFGHLLPFETPDICGELVKKDYRQQHI